ncbi:MAG: TOBE domain-containing protein [Truepera sp.]|nr:TOBE domain-containing protein [Truepera sp.]
MGFAAPSTFDLPEEFLLGIRPEDVVIRLDGEHRGEIILTKPLGVETIVHLRTGDEVLLSILWGFSHLSIGEEVAFTVGDERLQFFSTDGNRIAREVS